jgi:hypothetical protein
MTDENQPTRPAPEPGNTPPGEPGNKWVTPPAERPPVREEGAVSDPDQYAAGPLLLAWERPGALRADVVSNSDL